MTQTLLGASLTLVATAFTTATALAQSPPPAAAVCVEVDATNDTLAPEDQKAARLMLEQTLRNVGAPVTGQGCTETWRVYHIKLGQAVNVFLTGPRGFRQGQAAKLEELPAVYDQLVRSLVYGQPVSTAGDTVTRQNVTNQQASPRRVEADGVKFARLGYGTVFGPTFVNGPTLGFGYRYELDQMAIDVSFINILLDTGERDHKAGFNGSWVKLMGLWFNNPIANTSTYLGGGASWGGTAVADDAGNYYSGSGLQGELAAGYEFLRASTIRMFVQFDLTLPLYRIDRDLGALVGQPEDRTWAPTIGLSFGAGWGRGLSRVQVLQ